MPLPSFKKHLNIANQFLNEKVAGAKSSDKGDTYREMAESVDAYKKHFEEVCPRINEMLQPNPHARSKMMAVAAIGKIGRRPSTVPYPQAEQDFADVCIKHGRNIGEDTCYGAALVATGEAFTGVANSKYNMEDDIKECFLNPATVALTNDVKEISHLRKKLENRRLDFDCKRRTREKVNKKEDMQTAKKEDKKKVTEEEYELARGKYEETLDQTTNAMANFLDSEAEHLTCMLNFCAANLEHFKTCVELMEKLKVEINDKLETATKQQEENSHNFGNRYARTSLKYNNDSLSRNTNISNMSSTNHATFYPEETNDSLQERYSKRASDNNYSPRTSGEPQFERKPKTGEPQSTPLCRALYDFTAENASELNFEEDDEIKLIERIDENWYLGELNGKRGHFPVDYVEVIVPL